MFNDSTSDNVSYGGWYPPHQHTRPHIHTHCIHLCSCDTVVCCACSKEWGTPSFTPYWGTITVTSGSNSEQITGSGHGHEDFSHVPA